MAPYKSRVYGWRAGLLVFIAVALAAPLAFLLAGQGDGRGGYAVFAIVVTGLLAAWAVYATLRRRVGGGREV